MNFKVHLLAPFSSTYLGWSPCAEKHSCTYLHQLLFRASHCSRLGCLKDTVSLQVGTPVPVDLETRQSRHGTSDVYSYPGLCLKIYGCNLLAKGVYNFGKLLGEDWGRCIACVRAGR